MNYYKKLIFIIKIEKVYKLLSNNYRKNIISMTKNFKNKVEFKD